MFAFLGDRRVERAALLASLLLLAITLLMIKPIYDQVGDITVSWVYDVSIVVVAFLGAVLAMMLAQALERGEVLRTMWLMLGMGLILWGGGEAIWAVYDLLLEEPESVTLADFLWVIGYIPLFIALYLRFRTLRASPERGRIIAVVLIAALLIALAAIYVFQPILADEELSSLERIVYILYPVGDLIIGILALLVVFTLSGGALSRPWALIASGFLIVAVADLLYSYAEWQGTYQPEGTTNLISGLTDVPYYASYLLIVLGLYMQARLQDVA